MTIDFLALDSDKYIENEAVVYTDNVLVLKRGFFFAESVKLFDEDGVELESSAYSYDLPIPTLSGRSGKLIYGRIRLCTREKVATVTYRTPYSEDDNRYDDIMTYQNTNGTDQTFDYYNSFSGIFLDSINVISGNDLDVWLSQLAYLGGIIRNKVVGYDVLLDAIDQVFTKGIIRYADQVDVSYLASPAFIYVTEGGNTINASEWMIEWSIDGNNFTIDYSAMATSYRTLLSSLSDIFDTKYQGDFTEAQERLASITAMSSELTETSVKSMGSTTNDDLAYVAGTWVLNGVSIPSYYYSIASITATMDSLIETTTANYDKLAKVDMDALDDRYAAIISKLKGGYTRDNLEVVDSTTVRFNDTYLSNIMTKETLAVLLDNVAISGTVPTETNFSIMDTKVSSLSYTTDLSVWKSETANHTSVISSVYSLLDALCISKVSNPHTISSTYNLGDLI